MPIRTSEIPLISAPMPKVPVKRLQNVKILPLRVLQADTPPKQNVRLSGRGPVMKIDIKV